MNVDVKYWYLRDHKLFWMLNNSQIKQLCIITGFKKAKRGELILFDSDGVPKIFFLKKGNIKIVEMDDDGNEVIKEVLKKGDLFGELSLNTDLNNEEYAKVLTDDVIICSFLLSDFEKLMEENPGLAITYTKFVGFQMKRLKNNYSNLMFKDARTRLYLFIKDWAEKEGIRNGNKIVLNNYLTQQDIAQIICTTRQTATQLLNEFEQKGFISYQRKEIIIFDLEKFVL
jgi:CRP-like cAMP-binding protein